MCIRDRPNCVDPNEKQFYHNPEESDRIRVGWLGGSSHLADLEILRGTVDKLISLKDKMQFVLCGFDTRGSITQMNPQTGEEMTRKIKPKESVWYEYEKIFTGNYKTVDKDQMFQLMQFKFGEEFDLNLIAVFTDEIRSFKSNGFGKY